jgi:hypothetical protein
MVHRRTNAEAVNAILEVVTSCDPSFSRSRAFQRSWRHGGSALSLDTESNARRSQPSSNNEEEPSEKGSSFLATSRGLASARRLHTFRST